MCGPFSCREILPTKTSSIDLQIRLQILNILWYSTDTVAPVLTPTALPPLPPPPPPPPPAAAAPRPRPLPPPRPTTTATAASSSSSSSSSYYYYYYYYYYHYYYYNFLLSYPVHQTEIYVVPPSPHPRIPKEWCPLSPADWSTSARHLLNHQHACQHHHPDSPFR